jgi:hypothetical protein
MIFFFALCLMEINYSTALSRDHDIVLLDTTIQAQRPKPAKRKIQLWKRANIEGIKEDVANFVEDFNQTVFENIECTFV